MKRASTFCSTILWVAVIGSACGDDQNPPAQPTAGAGTQTPAVNATAATGTGAAGAAVSGNAETTGTSGAAPGAGTGATAGKSVSAAGSGSGATAGTSAATAGATAAASGSGGSSAGATATAGATPGAAGTSAAGASAAGTAGTTPTADTPPPVTEPAVYGYMIGITDIPAAVKFYTDVMKLTVEKDAVKRDDRTDTRLYSTQATRGGRVVLMKFDDMRETHKITAKLVWQAQSATAVNQTASTYPDYMSRLNIGIVQFDGPETYIQEVGGSFDTTAGASSISVPYPIALGFAVSDQPASRMFYSALGMTESPLGTFTVTDATGTGSITEYTVKYPTGPGVVLQAWSPERNAKDNPVGVILIVPDAQAVADKAVAAGGMIVKPAERSAAYDNRLLIVAKDPDGYILEIIQ